VKEAQAVVAATADKEASEAKAVAAATEAMAAWANGAGTGHGGMTGE
jgi:hypothetical protein